MNETNESKWLNLSNMDINFKNIIPNEKSKHLLKYSTIDINNTSNTQRVKVNISKKKSRLNQNSKKGLILENKLGSPREVNKKFQKKDSFAINNERNYTKHSEKRRHSQITKRLRHNKSCEDGININNEESNNNILYNSMICNKQEKNNLETNTFQSKNQKKTIEKKNFSSANLTNCKNTTSGKYKILASTLKDKKNISPIIYK